MTALTLPSLTMMGPTWQRDGAKFVLPKLTLGWQVIDWCEQYLLQPDGPEAGEPWRFTKEQERFILHWYAIDERGRFVYRGGMLRRMKGWGKDPLAAVICCVEFLGPCRFKRWGADGQPFAEPHYAACVQIAAVSQDQVKRNTMGLFPALLSPKAVREFELDIGKEIIYAFRGRCRLEMLTTSARSAEGPRPTFLLKNETQHWLPSNGGTDMADVVRRNAAKSRDGSTRTLSISNAHAPGEGSDAEVDYEAALTKPDGFLYDSVEAGPEVVDALKRLKGSEPLDPDEGDELRAVLMAGLEFCRGDSHWLDLQRLLEECESPQTSTNMALRFYFNRLAAGTDRAFDAVRWAQLADREHKVPDGALITLGFDGSMTRDHTALIGTEVQTGYQWVVGYWEPVLTAGGDIQIPVFEVDAAVHEAFERWDVWRLNADPFYWQEFLTAWAGRYNRPDKEVVVSWNTTLLKKMSVALLNYKSAIITGELTHDGDSRFAAAIEHAYKREQAYLDDHGERMWVIQKERPDSPLKIDAAMAGCLSWEARAAAVASGATAQEESEVMWV